MRKGLTALAVAGFLSMGSAASAAPPPSRRVAILGPKDNALVPRLQRNFADAPAFLSSAVVDSCARVIVAKNLYDLDADVGICTDGDTVTVWKMEDESVQLVEAFPILHPDDRTLEVVAARATIVARRGESGAAAEPVIVSGGGGTTSTAPVVEQTITPTQRDAPQAPPAPKAVERLAPRAVFGVGPMLLASKAGTSFAMSAEAEIGVSRIVTLVPWIATVPVPQDVSNAFGSASYRPTIFGLGLGIPLRSNDKTFVPRIGAGYAVLWMHTWPQSASPGTTLGESENLWAPAMYGTMALSVGITKNVRAAAEGMVGTSTHHMIVRIAHDHVADWGVPIASLGARAEVVIP